MCRSNERSTTRRFSLEFSSRNCRGSRNSASPSPAYFFFHVVGCVAYPQLAANLGDLLSALALRESVHDLFLRSVLFLASLRPSDWFQRTTRKAVFSTFPWSSFRVLGQTTEILGYQWMNFSRQVNLMIEEIVLWVQTIVFAGSGKGPRSGDTRREATLMAPVPEPTSRRC